MASSLFYGEIFEQNLRFNLSKSKFVWGVSGASSWHQKTPGAKISAF
jgi:hypothetical protein